MTFDNNLYVISLTKMTNNKFEFSLLKNRISFLKLKSGYRNIPSSDPKKPKSEVSAVADPKLFLSPTMWRIQTFGWGEAYLICFLVSHVNIPSSDPKAESHR